MELLAAVVILALLAGLCVAGFQKTVESSKTGRCASNLRTLAQAVLNYSADEGGMVPPAMVMADPAETGVAKAPQSQCRAERFANLDLGCDHPLGGAGTAPTWEQTTEAVSQALRRTAASGSPRRKPTATAAVNESPAPTVSRTMHCIPG